jgi:hypothetical protein
MAAPPRTILIVAIGTLVAVAVGAHTPIGEKLWPPAPMEKQPTPVQMAGFIFASLWEALGFGLGLALTIALVPVFRSFALQTPWAWPAFYSLAWLNLTWVVHDNLHIHVGEDPAGLVTLELVFHKTLIASGLIVGYFALRLAGAHRAATPAKGLTGTSASTRGR